MNIDEALERGRRAKLHRQIGALETKLKSIDPAESAWKRLKWWRLYNKKRRLEHQLSQPELPLGS